MLIRRHVHMYKHTRPQCISTSLQKGQKRVTDKRTHNIRARSLACSRSRAHTRTHTHTHTLHTHHTPTQTRTHSYASSKQKRFTSRKNRNFNLAPENKTCHIRRHVHMYTHTRPQRISTSLQKGQKRVTDKHTYIRARSYAHARDITLLMSSCLCQHDDITLM